MIGRDVRRRLTWTTGGQAISSLGNFGMTLLVARTASQEVFGLFSLCLVVGFFALGLIQSLTGEALLVANPKRPREMREREAVAFVVTAWLFATGVGVVVAITGGTLGSTAVTLIGTFIAIIPSIALLDVHRYAYYARGDAAAAFSIDLVWFCAQVATSLAVILAGAGSAGWLAASWGTAAFVAVVVVSSRRPLARFRPSRPKHWLRGEWVLLSKFGLESLIERGAGQLAIASLAFFGGLSGLAGFNAARTMLGPVNFVYASLAPMAVVELRNRSPESRHRATLTFAVVMSALPLLIWATAAAVPAGWGQLIMGNAWGYGLPYLGIVGVYVAAAGWMHASRGGIRAAGQFRDGLRARLVSAPTMLMGAVLGGTVGGMKGAAVGLAAGRVAAGGHWWWVFRRKAARSPSQPTSAE